MEWLFLLTFIGQNTGLLHYTFTSTALIYGDLNYWKIFLILHEHVHCRATKFILNDCELPYKEWLEHLHILPFVYIYLWIERFNQSLTEATFNLLEILPDQAKLVHAKVLQSSHNHFYYKAVESSTWNKIIDSSFSIDIIKIQLTANVWNQFTASFNSNSFCSYHIICPCYQYSRQPVSVNFSESLTPNHDFQL